jgi:NitT/TauT family transport system substrate-binding protein
MKRSSALLTLAAMAMPIAVRAQSMTKLVLALPPGTSGTPALYALKAGLFTKYGLDVELQKMNSGAAILAAIAGGSVQIGNGSAFSVVTAFAHGVPVQIMSGGVIYNSSEAVPYGMLLVGKNSPIKTAADLNGKTIGLAVARGDLNATTTQAWVEQNGGDWSTIKVLEIPQPTMVAAIDQGRIDAMTMQSPSSTIALASGKLRLLGRPYDAVAKRFTIATWFSATSWVASNADIIGRFNQAMAEASRYANAHPQEMIPILAAFSDVEPSVLEHAARTPFVDRPDVADIQPIIDLEYKYKVIDKTFSAKDIIAPIALNH